MKAKEFCHYLFGRLEEKKGYPYISIEESKNMYSMLEMIVFPERAMPSIQIQMPDMVKQQLELGMKPEVTDDIPF